MNQNEQLASIDRGAFWDLPYLRRLHLKFNPKLAKINSQAFVGTQNLQTIETEGCPSLEENGSQLLENITMSATSRQLRFEQQQQLHSIHSQANEPTQHGFEMAANTTALLAGQNYPLQGEQGNLSQRAPSTNATSISRAKHLQAQTLSSYLAIKSATPLAIPSSSSQPQPQSQSPSSSSQSQSSFQDRINGVLSSRNHWLKYIYYLGTVSFLVLALKLVFKYTSTGRYMERRRQRRRVFEMPMKRDSYDLAATCNDGRQSSSLSFSTADAYQLYEQPSELVIVARGSTMAAGRGEAGGDSTTSDTYEQSAPIPYTRSNGQDLDLDQCDALELAAAQALIESTRSVGQTSGLAAGDKSEVIANPEHLQLGLTPACCSDCPVLVGAELINEPAACFEVAARTPAQLGREGLDVEQEEEEEEEDREMEVEVKVEGGEVKEEEEEEEEEEEAAAVVVAVGEDERNRAAMALGQGSVLKTDSGRMQPTTIDLIHSQLIAAGFDYGHANCAHFYQSLGPALQLADMTANFVNDIDYY